MVVELNHPPTASHLAGNGFTGRREEHHPDRPAPPMGFEPTISTLTGWRALRAAPRGRVVPIRRVPGAGIEPAASAFRARRHYQQQLPRNFHAPHEAEGEGVEPSRLSARPSSSRVPSPFGLPFRQFQLRRQESNLRRPG